MSRTENQIYIELPPQRVYDYVSTPAKWPEWHPSSLWLDSGADQPLGAGARFEEDVRVANRDGHLSWTVREARPPLLWIADAVARDGLRLSLRYDLEAVSGGTGFRRTLDYQMAGLWKRILDRLLLHRRIARESLFVRLGSSSMGPVGSTS